MFTAYFDGSGSPHDTSIVAVAGFVASVDQWVEFERNWKDACNAFGVSSLHMRHYAHSRYEYESWKSDTKKRQRFLERLIAIIKARVRNSFASAVVMKDYEAARVRFRNLGIRPYALAGYTCIDKVARWARRQKIDAMKTVYVFEDGDGDRGQLAEEARKHLQVNPVFLKKSESAAFQAADLLAYEFLKANTKIYQADPQTFALADLRQPLQALETIPNGENGDDWGVHDYATLSRALSEDELISHHGE